MKTNNKANKIPRIINGETVPGEAKNIPWVARITIDKQFFIFWTIFGTKLIMDCFIYLKKAYTPFA